MSPRPGLEKMRFGHGFVLNRKMGRTCAHKEKFAGCFEYFIVDIDVGIFTGTFYSRNVSKFKA